MEDNPFILDFLGKEYIDNLKFLLELNDVDILYLTEKVNLEKEYGIQNYSDIIEILRNIKISTEKLISILEVAMHLHERIFEENIPLKNISKQLIEFCKKNKIKDYSKKVKAIEKLISVREGYKDKRRKIHYLITSLDYLASISGKEEFRAVYSDPRGKGELLGFIPILILKLELKNALDESSNVVFQVNEEDLEEMINELNDHKMKLSMLKNHIKEGIKIF